MLDQVYEAAFIIAACIIGVVIRLAKKFIVQDINPIDYLTVNYKRTLIAVGTIIGSAFAIYLANPLTPLLQYVFLAYMADSLVNKTPTSTEISQKHNTVK